jgi:SMI1-KNR4 cell-wall
MDLIEFDKWIFPESKQVVTFADIIMFESEMKITLPNQYKQFLLNCGIGKLYYNNLLTVMDNKDLNLMIDTFYSFGEIKNIYEGLQEFRDFNHSADKLYPIASTHASPLICIDLDRKFGQIAILSWDSGVALQKFDFGGLLNNLTFIDNEPDWKDPLFVV